jgi:uroporphyrin-III C-methyltransferase/precorrin-2 dehydrogenase/sirohydrochlorin ferrochelatase
MKPRMPAETPSTRMAPLAQLPLFVALDGRRAVVAGGTPAAAWKAELLSAAGASVDAYAPAPFEELKALAHERLRGPVTIWEREWTPADFDGAAIAVGAFEDEHEGKRFAEAARAAHVPVNIVDKPALCDFSFGAIVNRSPLVIGISTGGAAPVFGQAVRARLEAFIPRGFAHWADAARRWRRTVQTSGLSFNARRAFWRRFTAHAMAEPRREPEPADLERLLRETANQAADAHKGSVVLVGAGPGDPELLTLRAVRALQSADVILYDDLVSVGVLEFARREAKKMLVGKTGHGPSCRQLDINALMVGLATSGRRVVRLKGGDPMIFSRAHEEIAACRAAGISIEVVPGITTAQAVAGRLGVSLTQRKDARRLQYITGHGTDGRLPDDIDWCALADPVATTVIYMPRKTLPDLVSHAVAAGLDPATPAVAVASATRPGETILAATISELPTRIAAAALPGPLLVMFGCVFADLVAKHAEPACQINSANLLANGKHTGGVQYQRDRGHQRNQSSF